MNKPCTRTVCTQNIEDGFSNCNQYRDVSNCGFYTFTKQVKSFFLLNNSMLLFKNTITEMLDKGMPANKVAEVLRNLADEVER